MKRNYKKLKTLADFAKLDAPLPQPVTQPSECPYDTRMVLRMLVRLKYGEFTIPQSLQWLEKTIVEISDLDYWNTGIGSSWCYVTVRHGKVVSKTDDEWHFDGASFRTDLIPERNYVWVSHTSIEYKAGGLSFPADFDPCKHDLFSFAKESLREQPIRPTLAKQWYLLNPFCLHRRNPSTPDKSRTFIRISFPDVEGRDINNTANPQLYTPAWGRDPVKTFRDKLTVYKQTE